MKYSFVHTSWSIGKIEGSMTSDLNKRTDELESLRDRLMQTVNGEIDFIKNEVARRRELEKQP